MGVPPTNIEVIDSRHVLWPSFNDPVDVYLVQFEYSFGDRKSNFTSEAIYVPRSADAAENEGYLLSVVTDLEKGASSLAILDAQNVSAGPLAMAELGHRVPIGFHGGWRPGE